MAATAGAGVSPADSGGRPLTGGLHYRRGGGADAVGRLDDARAMYNQLSKAVTVSLPVSRDAADRWDFDRDDLSMSDRSWEIARDTFEALLEQSEDRFEHARRLYLWLSGWMLRDGAGGRECKVLIEPLGVVTAAPLLVTHTAQLCQARLTDYR
jgi:hypothetical protein